MCPERPGTCRAPRRQQAEPGPGGAMNTGLIRGLLHSDRPVSFCLLLLPRVHAADGAAAQAAQMPSSSTTPTSPGPRILPVCIGRPEFSESGWDRIKDLFKREDSKLKRSEEQLNLIKSTLVAYCAGFVWGGVPAAIHAKNRYVEVSRAETYTSRVDAVRSAQNAAIRGFLRYGFRWSWRVAAFVALFNSVSTGLTVYRDKSTLDNYAAAGAVTGGLFRLNLGLRGLVAGSIIGGVLGLPAGLMVITIQKLTGETLRERRRREHRELYELKVAEWEARLQLTEEIIGDLKLTAKHGSTKDLQRIEELINLPPNAISSDDSKDLEKQSLRS